MDVEIIVEKDDPRLRSIQKDIQKLYNQEKRKSCISDEEIRTFVKQYFMFESILKDDMHHDVPCRNGGND